MQDVITAALNTATANLAKRGIRGAFDCERKHAVIAVSWWSDVGGRLDITREALREAGSALRAAGFEADVLHTTLYVRAAAAAA